MLSKLKDILFSLCLLAFIVLALVFGPRACEKCPPDGYIIVAESFIDSLQKVATMKPDTIRDTITVKGDPVLVPRPYPVPVYINPEDTSKKVYSDRVFNDYLDAKVTMEVNGRLNKINWEYVPIRFATVTTISKPVPYPVRYEVPVKVPQTGFFMQLGLGMGFTEKVPALSGEIFYQMKKGLIGAEAGYFQGGYVQVKFGAPIKF